MPIADCGFPPEWTVDTQTGKSTVYGTDALKHFGPTIMVEVGFEANFFHTDPAQVRAAIDAVTAAPVVQAVPALLDTGAGESCIDEDLAVALGLPVVDRQPCSGVGGAHELNVYLGHIRITSVGYVQYGRFLGAKLKAGGQTHQVLLGRTLLAPMILVYDGRTGSVQIAY